MYLEFYGRHRLPSYITFGYRLAVFFCFVFYLQIFNRCRRNGGVHCGTKYGKMRAAGQLTWCIFQKRKPGKKKEKKKKKRQTIESSKGNQIDNKMVVHYIGKEPSVDVFFHSLYATVSFSSTVMHSSLFVDDGLFTWHLPVSLAEAYIFFISSSVRSMFSRDEWRTRKTYTNSTISPFLSFFFILFRNIDTRKRYK